MLSLLLSEKECGWGLVHSFLEWEAVGVGPALDSPVYLLSSGFLTPEGGHCRPDSHKLHIFDSQSALK